VHESVHYAVHTFKRLKSIETDSGTRMTNRKEFGVHIDSENLVYWTKWRCDIEDSVNIPEEVVNPTFDKFKSIIDSGNK
jgi:hypothetical protein